MPESKFVHFLRLHGLAKVAQELGISDRCVRYWADGRPPRLRVAHKVIELAAKAGFTLSMEDVRPGLPAISMTEYYAQHRQQWARVTELVPKERWVRASELTDEQRAQLASGAPTKPVLVSVTLEGD